VSDRSGDLLPQPERDLEHARQDVTARFFEHACFGAQLVSIGSGWFRHVLSETIWL